MFKVVTILGLLLVTVSAFASPPSTANFIDMQAFSFRSCKATGDNIASKFTNENVTVFFKDRGIFVKRSDKRIEPLFTESYLCAPTAAGDAICESDKMDVIIDPAKPINHVSLEKKCGSKVELSIPEVNRGAAHLTVAINFPSAPQAIKVGTGFLSCSGVGGPSALNSSLILSECR